MPFPQQGKPFNRDEILRSAPALEGCYGLFRANAWVYVGRGNIQARLLAHHGGDNPCITRAQPSHWVHVVTPNSEAEEKSLILQLDPPCNRRVG